ncbi:hypothetical protein Tco_1392024 [Tanacetum coccineum]
MVKNASNKRNWEGGHGRSSRQNKEHKVIRAHAVGLSNKKVYAGKLPHCNKSNLHHNEPCTAKCENCKENHKRGNQAESSEARGRVCALGGGEADQDPNNIADNINA